MQICSTGESNLQPLEIRQPSQYMRLFLIKFNGNLGHQFYFKNKIFSNKALKSTLNLHFGSKTEFHSTFATEKNRHFGQTQSDIYHVLRAEGT